MAQGHRRKERIANELFQQLGVGKPVVVERLCLRAVALLHSPPVDGSFALVIFHGNLEKARLRVRRTERDFCHKIRLRVAECLENLLGIPHGPIVPLALGTEFDGDFGKHGLGSWKVLMCDVDLKTSCTCYLAGFLGSLSTFFLVVILPWPY